MMVPVKPPYTEDEEVGRISLIGRRYSRSEQLDAEIAEDKLNSVGGGQADRSGTSSSIALAINDQRFTETPNYEF